MHCSSLARTHDIADQKANWTLARATSYCRISNITLSATMSLANRVRKLAERATRTHICRRHRRGIDLAQDIQHSLPAFQVSNIFDVGANVGQSAEVFLVEFPRSRIYSFEPVGNTFRQLQRNFAGNKRVECYQLAFSAANGAGTMMVSSASVTSSLFNVDRQMLGDGAGTLEHVKMVTLDDFCDSEKIERINYVKIDTEGGDLDVLRGSVRMLQQQRIDIVQVEAGMNPNTGPFVPFESLKAFLESHEYFVFGIYEQKNEFIAGAPHLRRTNPVFISSRIIQKYSEPL
jgi:FkbM family methyltransferase